MSARIAAAGVLACWAGVWWLGGFWAFFLALVASAGCYVLGEEGKDGAA